MDRAHWFDASGGMAALGSPITAAARRLGPSWGSAPDDETGS